MKIDFEDSDKFAELEDRAIDGNLNYSEFPPEEYKYFSKLAQLGYKNRHDGWSVEICTEKQNELRNTYKEEKKHSGYYFEMACRIQDNIKRGEMLITEVYKADNNADRLHFALQALGKIVCEDGLESRVMKNGV